MNTFEESFIKRWGRADKAVITHEKAPYDPVKAHEYYIRTRKLKGRKKNQKTPDAVKKEYQGKLTKFLGSLPMAKKGASDGGADLKKTAQFVNRMRKMSDKEMVAEAKRLTKPKAGSKYVSQEAMGQIKTINALLKNRSRVRAAKGTGPKNRVTPQIWEDGSVSNESFVPKKIKQQSKQKTVRTG